MRILVAFLLLVHAGAALEAQEAVGPALMPQALASQEQILVPVFMPSELRPLGILRTAAEGAVDELEAMRAWNRAGQVPPRNGFVRPLPLGERVRVSEFRLRSSPQASTSGELVWAGRIEVAGAHRLRIHLEDVQLPSGSQLWISGGGGETVGPFGLELLTTGSDLWTPSVSGPAATLIVRLSGNEQLAPKTAFRIMEVAEIFEAGNEMGELHLPNHVQSCLIDGRCITSTTLDVIDLYRSAVAHLEFINDGVAGYCTGALLTDTDESGFIPYLLTANHCFKTQAAASSLEAFWDAFATYCGGGGSPSLPRSNGSTLLATNAQTDFTFVRLNSLPPPPRILLGWNPSPSAWSFQTQSCTGYRIRLLIPRRGTSKRTRGLGLPTRPRFFARLTRGAP